MATLSQGRVAGWASRWLTDELNALSRSGNWEGAIAAFHQVGSSNLVHQNVFHYTTIINACGRAGQLDAALSTFEHMKRQHVTPNVYTYTALINACSVARNADTALRLFGEMRMAEVPPNVKTITALIAACAKEGQWRRAFKILEQSEEMLVAPNIFTFTAAMDACRRAKVCEPAVALLDRLRNPEQVRPNEVTYNTVLGACAAAGNAELAIRVYAQMVADGYEPTNYTKTLLTELFQGTAEEGLADDMHVRVRPSRRDQRRPDSDPATAMRAMEQAEE